MTLSSGGRGELIQARMKREPLRTNCSLTTSFKAKGYATHCTILEYCFASGRCSFLLFLVHLKGLFEKLGVLFSCYKISFCDLLAGLNNLFVS